MSRLPTWIASREVSWPHSAARPPKLAVITVTPTPSRTVWQALRTPVGLVSLFGYETPIPYPFGAGRIGYLVQDLDVFLFAVVLLFIILIIGSKMGGPRSGDRFRDECERSYGQRGESAVLDCIINLRARFLLEYEQKKLDDTYRRAR